MPYTVECNSSNCLKKIWVDHIVDLIEYHTDEFGKLKCNECGVSDAYIHKKTTLQEKGEEWERYIKGVIRIDTGVETYSPYIFLVTGSKNEQENFAYHFNYYKDCRDLPNGKLKHGHGPGGAPVFSSDELLQLLKRLMDYGAIKVPEIEKLIKR
jgi:hypothetical protein